MHFLLSVFFGCRAACEGRSEQRTVLIGPVRSGRSCSKISPTLTCGYNLLLLNFQFFFLPRLKMVSPRSNLTHKMLSY